MKVNHVMFLALKNYYIIKFIFVLLIILLFCVVCNEKAKHVDIDAVQIADSIYYKCDDGISLISNGNSDSSTFKGFIGVLLAGTQGDEDFSQGFNMDLSVFEYEDKLHVESFIRVGSIQNEHYYVRSNIIANDSICRFYLKLIKSADPMKLRCIKNVSQEPGCSGFEGYSFLFIENKDTNSVNLMFLNSDYYTVGHQKLMNLFEDSTFFVFTLRQLRDSTKYKKIISKLAKLDSRGLLKQEKQLRNFSSSLGY